MSLSRDAIIGAVVDCLSRIPLYTDVYKYESCTVQSGCEVSVKLCGGQHDPWGRCPDAYSFSLRSCLPLGIHSDNIEETLRQLWAAQMEVFKQPYIQDGYTIVWNLSRFSTSYLLLEGIACRIMDSRLSCEIEERTSGRLCRWRGNLSAWERAGCLSCGRPRNWMDCYEEQLRELEKKVLAIRGAAISEKLDCYQVEDLWILLQVAREEFNALRAKRRKEC